MRRFAMMLKLALLLFAFSSAMGQQLAPASSSAAPSVTPSAEPSPPALDEEIVPTFETQKLARTYILDIPAPRGQITDRNGAPLAQNQLSYNLAINFPTPLEFSDAQTLDFAHRQIAAAAKLIGRQIRVPDEAILRHYHNRGILPFEIATNLSAEEYEAAKAHLPAEMTLRGVYLRVYPQGKVAGQIVGYCGRTGRNPDGIIDNHETIWPETEGREGIEQTFNAMLTGKHGEYKMTFDKDGRKTSEKIVSPPVPGHTVVTTLDLRLQELAERALEAKAKRGAIVIMDPNNGDVLALASWPDYNPNVFVPSISAETFKALQDDPGIPLLPRAFRSSYPPGSTFKVAVGIAALESGSVTASEQYQCVSSIQIGNLTFHNWKKSDRGFINFVQALTESCDTWFYQVGIKTGAEPIIDWAQRLGFGAKCGIPIRGEVEGRVPNDSYMKATHGRKLLNGDIANLSIETMAQLRTGMVDAVNAPAGTAHAASLETVTVAGKTGTAQWGPKNKERTAAWFAGYAPAEKPQYAFAALYEGDVGVKAHGGTVAAPMIAQVLKELYKGDQANGRRHRRPQAEESPTVRRAEPVDEDAGD